MAYSIAIFSEIPVYRIKDGYLSDPLWVRDLSSQISVTSKCRLIAPVLTTQPPDNLAPLPETIDVRSADALSTSGQAAELVAKCDVVQVPGNLPFWKAGRARWLLRAANRQGAVGILGISSNRAKTMILNAKSKPLSPVRLIKGHLQAAGIIASQIYLAGMSDGLLLVGEGLKSLLAARGKNIHIGTASWISQSDIIPQTLLEAKISDFATCGVLKFCIAARLERMKGVHIALDALKLVHAKLGGNTPTLTILGAGPELHNLQAQVARNGMGAWVSFLGTRQYPEEFFGEIEQHHVMLLSNLNDEQPRLVFDAGARGMAVLCPDSVSYRGIGMPQLLCYKRGDSKSLADAITNLGDREVLSRAAKASWDLAQNYTIDKMHELRAVWISDLLEKSHRAIKRR